MRGLYRVAEAGRPACMTDPEYALWLEANAWHPAVSVKSPCSDCPLEWARAMRELDACDGVPGIIPWRPLEGPEPEFMVGRPALGQPLRKYETEEQRIAARRASWRASGARKRAAAAGVVA